ncbi:hypothetical protein Taro_045994, partial [Colocasia esculenta]|nr:hypothetical protein [Colocasia esculenta]
MLATRGATNCYHHRPAMNSCYSESLPGKSRGSTTKQRKQRNASTTTRVRPKMTPAEPANKPSAHTRRDKEAHGTPECARETRVSKHKHPTSQTSTRSGRNNQVSPRETPNNHVRSNVSPQARPPQTSTRSRADKQNPPASRVLHEVRELHTAVPPQTAPTN